MAQLTEANQIGKREDLSDVIAVVDARSTPITSMMPKGKEACNTLFDWQVDAYEPNNTEGVVDGADATSFDTQNNRKKLSGRVQKKWRNPSVSDFAEDVSDVAGVGKKKEFAREIRLSIENLKRDMECVAGSDNDSQEQSGSTPYKTRGLGKWIQSSAQSDLPVPEDFRTPAASIDTTATGSLTETEVQDVLESVYNETGKRKRFTLICGTKLKRAFTDFGRTEPGVSSSIAAVRTYNQDGTSKEIVATIDFFSGDFGELELHPSTFLAHGTAHGNFRGYVLDPMLLEMRYNRRPSFNELENKGGGRRGITDAIFAICCKNPLGLGKFAATS